MTSKRRDLIRFSESTGSGDATPTKGGTERSLSGPPTWDDPPTPNYDEATDEGIPKYTPPSFVGNTAR